MTQKTETLSYQLSTFIKYKEQNSSIPHDLLPYCYNNREFNKPNIQQYIDDMKLIVDTISKGINTNDVIFKNDVKYLINTINKKNYNDALNKLKLLNLTQKENIQFLAHELIVCTMRCPIGIKGIHKEKATNKSKALSEVISDVIKHFCTFVTAENNGGIGFHDELLKMCKKFFMDFVSLTKSMDQNNENTSDNYKGFMTLLGLMYENNLLPHKIVLECLDSIKRTIFCSKINTSSEQIINKLTKNHAKMFGYDKVYRTELFDHIVYFDTEDEFLDNVKDRFVCYRNATECTNFFKGYENFANHFVSLFKNKVSELTKNIQELNDEHDANHINNIKSIITKNLEFLEQFIKLHEEIAVLNDKFRIKNKDQMLPPLKAHIMLIHSEIGQELHNLVEKLASLL
jgi:hypothetical protein